MPPNTHLQVPRLTILQYLGVGYLKPACYQETYVSAFSATRTHVARQRYLAANFMYSIARDRVFGVLYLTAVISGADSVVYYTVTYDNCYSNTTAMSQDSIRFPPPSRG